ncbi:MAG: hypothetical protein LW834_07935 [Cyanobium sp. 49614_E6]|jgi:hypothetical protein|nr:hypothetical protein [Cyanobium sp. 49614_E6]
MRLSRTIILGAGGTGGLLIPSLARLLRYHPAAASDQDITVVDGDVFEEHNRQRQHIGDAQVGLNKAAWIRDLCALQGLAVIPVDAFADRPLLTRLVRSGGGPLLLVAAVDNDATRALCIEVLLAAGRDFFFVTPGNSSADDPAAAIKGQVLWFGQDGDRQYGINPALVFPNIEHPQDAVPRAGSCANQAPSAPQLLTANALAAAQTLAVIQNLLDDALPATSSSVFFNGRSFKSTFS